MPSQIMVTAGQLSTLAETGHNVIITEAVPHQQTLDCWVLDDESVNTETHRSLVLTPEGEVIGDERIDDNN